LSTNPIPEENTTVTEDTAPAPNAWPDDPAVEDNSYDFQGTAEKEIERDDSPVITKESGLVEPEITIENMEEEEERGLKRSADDDDESTEG